MTCTFTVNEYRFSVFVKVDCGYGRAGVPCTDASSVQLCVRLAQHNRIDLRGIYTHSGHSYDAKSTKQLQSISQSEAEAAAK